MYSFVVSFFKALAIVFLGFAFRFPLQGCFDLFQYRGYRFLSVVLLVLCHFVFLFSIGGILYV
nr:MAG TPA: hypothetical protein [Inoviridae sp.]